MLLYDLKKYFRKSAMAKNLTQRFKRLRICWNHCFSVHFFFNVPPVLKSP
jgi:hypothetical protein